MIRLGMKIGSTTEFPPTMLKLKTRRFWNESTIITHVSRSDTRYTIMTDTHEMADTGGPRDLDTEP